MFFRREDIKPIYSQLPRFYRHNNNTTGFLFHANRIYHKLISNGYEHNRLWKTCMIFCHRYQVSAKYGESILNISGMRTFDSHVVCDINNNINKVIKPCSMKMNKVTKVPICKDNEPTPLPLNHFEEQRFSTVKPVCNDRLYNKIYYLWFI